MIFKKYHISYLQNNVLIDFIVW